MVVGTLLQLYLRNVFCCCFVNSEERNAYQSIRAIQSSCRYIVQYPLKQQQNANSSNGTTGTGTTGGSATSFITNLFGSPIKTNNSAKHRGPTQPRRVRLVLQDSDTDGQPIVRIESIDSNLTEQSDASSSSSLGTSIKVRRMNKVQLDDNQIVIYDKKNCEVLRFAIPLEQQLNDETDNAALDDTIESSNSASSNTIDNIAYVSTDVRNMLVHHFMVVVEWERQRCIVQKEKQRLKDGDTAVTNDNADSDVEDDEDGSNSRNGNGNFITRHAAKVKHYAQREMELQRVKRTREIRKAELIAQSGGLKYTALAMMNNTNTSV